MSTLIQHILEKLNEYKLVKNEISKDQYLDNDFGLLETKFKWFDLDKKEIYVYICNEEIEYGTDDNLILKIPPPSINIDNYDRNLESLCNLKPQKYYDAYGGCNIKWNKIHYNLIGTYDCDFEGNLLLCTIDENGFIELITLGLNSNGDNFNLKKLLYFEGQVPNKIVKIPNFLDFFDGKRGIFLYPKFKNISLAYDGPIYNKRNSIPWKNNLSKRILLYLREHKQES